MLLLVHVFLVFLFLLAEFTFFFFLSGGGGGGGVERRGKEPFQKFRLSFIPLTSKSDCNLIPPYNFIIP